MSQDNRRPRVLVADRLDDAGIAILQRVADVDVMPALTSADLPAHLADYEALIVRSRTDVTASTIEHARRLKVIGCASATLNHIDIAAAQAAGIDVVNSPGAHTIAVAEHTVGLMLALARRVPYADATLKQGQWEKPALIGTGLAGKTLGIIGFGRIGREVALRAHAFGMSLLVNQPGPTPELELSAKIDNVDLYELLRSADFVTLHVPLTAETMTLIGMRELSLLKPSAYLINTARAEIIDEAALLDALNAQRLAGAALDVFQEEPSNNSALIRHPRVIATPHIGARTRDARRDAAITVAQRVVNVLEELELESVLPLRVVALDKVVPHESVDAKRVNRLAARLRQENTLLNPPVVTEVDGRYMVLDGATRTAALKQIGLPHVVVQVISEEEGLGLRTWYHVIQQVEANELLRTLKALASVTLREVDPDSADDVMFEYGGLCYLHLVDGRTLMVDPQPGVNRLHALNAFTEAYIAVSHVERTLEDDLVLLQHEYPEMTALVVFPEFTVGQVMQVTLSGRYFPAGITRFIIPGRVLRLNADLDYLMSDRTLREKNRWLHELLLQKAGKGKIRYYGEPVYLLDE